MKGSLIVVALAAVALLTVAPPAHAQAGKRYYCGSGENTGTCGPVASPGIGSSCANAGCHTRNPLNDQNGRVMKAAGSTAAIQGSPDAGMQAIVSLYTESELDAIASWLLSLTTASPAPVCSVSASHAAPTTGATITLTASCSNAPTGWSWTSCSSASSTCTTTQSTAGNRTYVVSATNAGGTGTASVTVAWTAPGATPPPPPPPPAPPPEAPPPTTTVVEYLHAGFGHYFITSFQAEIDALDAGRVSGWARTGRTFKGYTTTNGNQRVVCRFFTAAFPPKSSHFYTSNSEECGLLRQTSRDWQFEADAFWVPPADAVMGSCPTGTQAVYRLYNDGQSGAPNHRYTTDPLVRIEMMGKRWIPEGSGPEGVAFCAPL